MSYWARFVTRVAVRRVVSVVVLLVLAWAGIGRADASDKEEQYKQCIRASGFYDAGYGAGRSKCIDFPSTNPPGTGSWQCQRVPYTGTCHINGGLGFNFPYTACPSGTEWNEALKICSPNDCGSRTYDPRPRVPVNGSRECNTGCQVQYHDRGDGFSNITPTGHVCKSGPDQCESIPEAAGKFIWNPYMNVCQPVAPTCPEGQESKNGACVRKDMCPMGTILNEKEECVKDDGTCAVGQIKAPNGACITDPNPEKACRKAGMVVSDDGTCKADADDDGIADEDQEAEDPNDPDKKKSKFSGGDNCEQPPECSGDAIMCGQARIQWRIECNTRRNQKISGGSCENMPVCVGDKCDLMEYNQLIQQWKTSCSLEKMLKSMGGPGLPGGGGNGDGKCPNGSEMQPDDLNCNGQPDWTENAADGQNPDLGDEGVPDGLFVEGGETGGSPGGLPGGVIDSSGLGWSRSCPVAPVVQVMGRSITIDTTVFCNIMFLSGQLVLIGAALFSLKVLGGGGRV